MSVVDFVPLPGTRTPRLPEAEIHDVLRNDRRRSVLEALRTRAGEASVAELTDAIVAREAQDGEDRSRLRQSVYSSLHQTHLPKLEAAEIVTYDRSTKQVRLGTNSREVARYFQLRSVHGISWGEYYQLFAVTSLLAALFVELELWVFGVVDPLPVLTVALTLLALSVGYQLWSRRWIYVRSLVS
jgi:hypothetical protein